MIKSFQEKSALLMYSFLINFEFPWIESIQIVSCSTLCLITTPCLVWYFLSIWGLRISKVDNKFQPTSNLSHPQYFEMAGDSASFLKFSFCLIPLHSCVNWKKSLG